jgi:hypothetical protein
MTERGGARARCGGCDLVDAAAFGGLLLMGAVLVVVAALVLRAQMRSVRGQSAQAQRAILSPFKQ